MITTALLVRWAGGWHEVTRPASITAHGRKEAALGLGASQSVAEVETVAGQQLAIFGDPRTEIAGDYAPRSDSELPFVAFGTADRIAVPDMPPRPPANQRVQAITATMDDEGVVTYAIELADVLLSERERFDETLKKMANGTLGGDSKVAQPVGAVASVTVPDCCPPTPPPPICS